MRRSKRKTKQNGNREESSSQKWIHVGNMSFNKDASEIFNYYYKCG